MKIPNVFLLEKDLGRKVHELVKSEKASRTKRISDVKEFSSGTVEDALADLLNEGYKALFMPSIVDIRIEASGDEMVWKNWYCSPSIMATGKTKQGKAVVIYAHIPNYFSNPDNIKEAKRKGLVNWAGIIPDKEFQRLLDLEDHKNVFVVDYNLLRISESGVIRLRDALKHPQTIPFLGGVERAEKYLERHEEIYGGEIGVWHGYDLQDKPVGRLLFVGINCDYGLYGNSSILLYDCGRFVGLRAEVALANKESY